MITFSIYIPKELNEKIEHLAKLNDCSKNKQVVRFLEQILGDDERYNEIVQEIMLFRARTKGLVL